MSDTHGQFQLSKKYSFASEPLVMAFCKIAADNNTTGDIEEMLSVLENNFNEKRRIADESTGETAVRL